MAQLNLNRDPVRLLTSAAPWLSARYLLGYLLVGSALFTVAVTAVAAAAALSITVAGLPALIAAAIAVRRCADVERRRLGSVDSRRLTARYAQPAGRGWVKSLRARWTDPTTWRDIAYLIGMWVPLLALDTVVLTLWLVFLAGITLPAWYWAPWQTVDGVRYHGYQLGYFPHGPHGPGGWGFYVDSLPAALLVAAICLAAFLLFNYVLVGTASAHARAVRGLLGEPTDPLQEAREVLISPGPLAAADAASRPPL
jgi:hypothetical protein